MARLLCVIALVLAVSAGVSAVPKNKRVHSALHPLASLPTEKGMEESAAEFGVSFITDSDLLAAHDAAVAHAMEEANDESSLHHHSAHHSPLAPPAPGPAASSFADPMLSRAAAAGFKPVAPQPAVQGSGSLAGLSFELKSQAEVEAMLSAVKKSGIKVSGESEALAAMKAKGLFNANYMDARVQLEAGRRAAMISAVKESCKAALDQLQFQVSVAFSAPPVVTLALTCGNMRVCSMCVYKAVVAILVPGFASISAVGKDNFAETECEPQLVTWCNGIVNQWLCDMDALEGLSSDSDEEREVQNDRLRSNKFCTDAFDAKTDTAALQKCHEFTRFLRPIRPDIMRRMRCNLNSGPGAFRRAGAALGRGLVSRLPLVHFAGNAIDKGVSKWAVDSTFACPRSSHDRVQEVCNYFMPLLGIPALKDCEKDMNDQPIEKKDGGGDKAPLSGFDCIDKGIDKLFKENSKFDTKKKDEAAPEGCKALIWSKFAALADDTNVKSKKELTALKGAAVCPAAGANAKIPVCQAQALVCAAVAKATAMNRVWTTENKKTGAWYDPFVQKIKRKDMCNSLQVVSPAIKHRCKRFVKANEDTLPYLLLQMGCRIKDKKFVDDEMTQEFLTCRDVDAAETNHRLNAALEACITQRNALTLPVLSTCSDEDLGVKPNQDYGALLTTYLALLESVKPREADITKSTLFYRVLAEGGTEWEMKQIQQATLKVKKGSDLKYCQHVVEQELKENNSPCGSFDTTEKPKCVAAREKLLALVDPGRTTRLSTAIQPFLTQQSSAWNWKAEKFTFATAGQYVCNKLTDVDPTTKARIYYEEPTAVNAAPPECAFCMAALPKMLNGQYNSPPESTNPDKYVEYLAGLRLKYAFGTSLYRVLGKFYNTNRSTKDSFKLLDAWVTALQAKPAQAQADAVANLWETLRTAPAGQIKHVPAPFDPTSTDVAAVRDKQAFDVLVASSLAQLKKSDPWIAKAKATERYTFWCQAVLPQCGGFVL